MIHRRVQFTIFRFLCPLCVFFFRFLHLYDLGIILGLIASVPKILWNKKGTIFLKRLRSKPPTPHSKPVIWIHAVSMGEMKSAKALFSKIKATFPKAFILITTATHGGFEEAQRSFLEADAICYMPFDFSWTMRRWAKRLKPQLLLLVESDFWFHHLHFVKKWGGKIALVSGKMSEKSGRWFSRFSFFSKRLFSHFDHLLVQNQEYWNRFASLVENKDRVHIGGNLKLLAVPEPVQTQRSKPGLSIALISTHAPEEEELLNVLQTHSGTIFLAPRHAERFDSVAKLLEEKGISYRRWSLFKEAGPERVVLVDCLGQIPKIYALSDIAIVAGSFSSQIGGHNVLEPCLYGIPVLFGPSMHNQKELAERVLQAGAGCQVASADLAAQIKRFCETPAQMKGAALALSQKLFMQQEQMFAKTLEILHTLLGGHRISPS